MFIPHPSLPVHLTEQWTEALSVTEQEVQLHGQKSRLHSALLNVTRLDLDAFVTNIFYHIPCRICVPHFHSYWIHSLFRLADSSPRHHTPLFQLSPFCPVTIPIVPGVYKQLMYVASTRSILLLHHCEEIAPSVASRPYD
jgi:hypothetical protein